MIRKRVLVLVERWNWKAAVLSIIGRAPIFLVTTYAYGWRSASLAAGVETAYCAGTAGVFAGLIQAVRNWRPTWLAAVLITVGIPVFSQGLDYSVHFLMHTPNLRTGTLAALTFSEISALFNWYSMRRGSFLVGSGQDSFVHDLCRFPQLIVGFLLAPPTWMWRCTRQVLATCGGDNDD